MAALPVLLIVMMITPMTAHAAPIVAGEAGGGTWSGLLLYIGVAIAFSFLCSVLEAVLLSTSPSYLESRVNAGSRAAKIMQTQKENVDTPISAILTLNTIAHTVGSAGAGAEAAALFGSEYLGVISAVLTLLILVFSEIIPKTIGATYWKQLTGFAAYTIRGLVWLLYPLVWSLQQITRLIRKEGEGPSITRTEIEAMASLGADEGALQESENRVLSNLLHLDRVHVADIMTPRTVVFALQQDTSISEVLKLNRLLPYSRIPVFDDNMDDVAGFVLRHDILTRAAKGQTQTPLREFKRPLEAVPETISVAKVLDEFMTRGEHLFLVFDEYGGTAGIITMEDAIESLLGAEITDESDIAEDLRKVAAERYTRQMELLNSIQAEPLQAESAADTRHHNGESAVVPPAAPPNMPPPTVPPPDHPLPAEGA